MDLVERDRPPLGVRGDKGADDSSEQRPSDGNSDVTNFVGNEMPSLGHDAIGVILFAPLQRVQEPHRGPHAGADGRAPEVAALGHIELHELDVVQGYDRWLLGFAGDQGQVLGGDVEQPALDQVRVGGGAGLGLLEGGRVGDAASG